MLIEEQTAELLQRCEKLLGIELRHTRGCLKNAENRAAAVWELLVIEAASCLGAIEYEPHPGGSPDIKLQMSHGRALWLEATYLYPRFGDEERRSDAVRNWLFAEARDRGVPMWKIFPRLDGRATPAGPMRELPALHERSLFLKQPELVRFFDEVLSNPNDPQACILTRYTVAISYNPDAEGPHISSGGLVQETPKVATEHALYRKLKAKAGQFKVPGPLIVCVGCDNSPALSPGRGRGVGIVSAHEAVSLAFSQHPSLSAAIIISIEYRPMVLGLSERQARAEILLNDHATNPLTPMEIQALRLINFNRWTYTFPLEKWKRPNANVRRRVTGTLTWRPGPMGIEIEIPANIVVDALAGRGSLNQAFDLRENHPVKKALDEGWSIMSCRMIERNIEAGEAQKVVLELSPPSLSVFGPRI